MKAHIATRWLVAGGALVALAAGATWFLLPSGRASASAKVPVHEYTNGVGGSANRRDLSTGVTGQGEAKRKFVQALRERLAQAPKTDENATAEPQDGLSVRSFRQSQDLLQSVRAEGRFSRNAMDELIALQRNMSTEELERSILELHDVLLDPDIDTSEFSEPADAVN